MSTADLFVVEQFQNFLSWEQKPRIPNFIGPVKPMAWPPAVWAYARGLTEHCPPKGEM